jgi:hypothetical protein
MAGGTPLRSLSLYPCFLKDRLLWEETSRKIPPSHPRSAFGWRAFASSLESAPRVAFPCEVAPWVKEATAPRCFRCSE